MEGIKQQQQEQEQDAQNLPISAALATSAYAMAISSGVPVTLRIKGFLVGVSVPRCLWPTISLMMPRYSDKVKGEYPNVLREEIGVVMDLVEEGLSTFAESVVEEVVDDDDVVVVGVLADRSPSGVPCGMVLPGSKKMN